MEWTGTYSATVDLYCKRKSDNTWVKVGTVTIDDYRTAATIGALPGSISHTRSVSITAPFVIEQAPSGNEFGIQSPDGTITAFTSVQYNTVSSATETAVTQLVDFIIEAPLT